MQKVITALREFDSKRNWNTYDTLQTPQEKIDYMYQEIVNLLGELGEFANEVKKCRRDKTWNDAKLKEELTDTFIFLLKLALVLKMDLTEETIKKININEERFKHLIVNRGE